VQITKLVIAALEMEGVVQEPISSQRHGIDFNENSIIAEHLTSKHQQPKKV